GGTSNLNVKFTLSATDPNAQGWLNYYEINFRRQLTASNNGDQFSFRDKSQVGIGNISEFDINNIGNNFTIWDVTDPMNIVKQEYVNSSGMTSFIIQNDQLHEFIAFDGQQYRTPYFTSPVANQNLHGMAESKMIIVTNPLFLQQANE